MIPTLRMNARTPRPCSGISSAIARLTKPSIAFSNPAAPADSPAPRFSGPPPAGKGGALALTATASEPPLGITKRGDAAWVTLDVAPGRQGSGGNRSDAVAAGGGRLRNRSDAVARRQGELRRRFDAVPAGRSGAGSVLTPSATARNGAGAVPTPPPAFRAPPGAQKTALRTLLASSCRVSAERRIGRWKRPQHQPSR